MDFPTINQLIKSNNSRAGKGAGGAGRAEIAARVKTGDWGREGEGEELGWVQAAAGGRTGFCSSAGEVGVGVGVGDGAGVEGGGLGPGLAPTPLPPPPRSPSLPNHRHGLLPPE